MDAKDQITPSGHESHGVRLCHRCGWPFPNPHPSAKNRRSHKKICGTLDGYSNLIEAVSDNDKEKTPSPKKTGISGAMRVSFSRSEDELFSDAVTEFPNSGTNSGSANKTLDRDVFFSFKDAENDDISKVDNTRVEVPEKIDTHVEKLGVNEITTVFDSSESNPQLTEPGLVKDGVTGHIPEPSHISYSQETKSIDVTETEEEKSQLSETIGIEAKDSELTKTTPEGSAVDQNYLEKHSIEQIQELVNEPNTVLTEKEDLGGPHMEKSVKEQIQEVVNEPNTVLTEKEDLGGPHLEEQSNEHNHEVIEKGSKDEVIEQKVDNDSSVVADVSAVTQQFSSDDSVINGKNASDVVNLVSVEEGKMNKQDSGAALSVGSSTRSSLEGNWGSVSVLSTASFDIGTLQSSEKSKVNSGKSNAATSDALERPSSENKEKKPESSKLQDSQKQQSSEVKVRVNESEGRKRNEEAIAKVTNWTTGKQSTRLKNLLGEEKDEAVVKSLVNTVNDDVASPRKVIGEDGKKGRKKVKGVSSWYPFVCCSSVNVVN